MNLRISVAYGTKRILNNVSLNIEEGEIVGLVGRSGEGKSTIALSILGLRKCTGEIIFEGRDLLKLTPREMRQIRGKRISLIPQSPLAALNPNVRLGAQLEEAWRAHQTGKPDWKPLLESVSLPAEESFLRQYPRNLSVGLAQRFLIAMALLHNPGLLLADESTSALDTITQAEILALFRHLNRTRRIAILYISHDLASVASLCHRVAILHEGEIVECNRVDQIFQNPQHDYTKKLIAAIPSVHSLYSPVHSMYTEN